MTAVEIRVVPNRWDQDAMSQQRKLNTFICLTLWFCCFSSAFPVFWEVDLFCWLLQPSRGHTPVAREAQSEILHGGSASFRKQNNY